MSGIPDYQTFMRPVLEGFSRGKRRVAEIIPGLILEFDISEEDAQRVIPSGKANLLANRAHWARTYLSKAGCLRTVGRNNFEITEIGRRVLSDNPERIDNDVLQSLGDFADWRANARRKKPEAAAEDELEASETPDVALDRITRQLDEALASELLQAISLIAPKKFEDLIVDLLIAMGYGGGDASMGQSIGRSGDGGIDGIINEDALGLDAVYVQAKRYAPDNKVGRPAIQAFVVSLTGESATKGVFVTTSDFSREARDYVDRVQQRIVLINDDRLARLMIRHEVGVRARQTYVIRSVDEDYFSEGLG